MNASRKYHAIPRRNFATKTHNFSFLVGIAFYTDIAMALGMGYAEIENVYERKDAQPSAAANATMKRKKVVMKEMKQ